MVPDQLRPGAGGKTVAILISSSLTSLDLNWMQIFLSSDFCLPEFLMENEFSQKCEGQRAETPHPHT